MSEKIILELKFDTKNKYNYSVSCNDYRVGGIKWNDIDNGIYHKIEIDNEDLFYTLNINPNQKVIECLKEVRNNFNIFENGYGDTIVERGKNGLTFWEYIDNKIKELEKRNEHNSIS